jgi:hypothetical protein
MTASPGIVGIGLNCPLGQGLDAASHAYRTRARNFVKSARGPIGPDGHPVVLSCVLPYGTMRGYQERLQRLFAGAVEDLVSGAAVASPMALRLVLPAWLAGHDMAGRLRDWIMQTYPSLFHDVAFLADGATVALYEVARASQELENGETPGLIVGALDSHMDAELLDVLSATGRLYHRANPHGLIPGEAAVLFMLGTPGAESQALGTVRAAFTGYETENLSSPQGIIGRGLAKPLRQAFEKHVPDRFLADLNGERWRSEDIGFALSGARVPDALLADIETPIGRTGDCGAANSMVMAAMALAPYTVNEAPAQTENITSATMSIVSAALWQGPRLVAVMEAFNGQAEPA